jgi:hypothetical protein
MSAISKGDVILLAKMMTYIELIMIEVKSYKNYPQHWEYLQPRIEKLRSASGMLDASAALLEKLDQVVVEQCISRKLSLCELALYTPVKVIMSAITQDDIVLLAKTITYIERIMEEVENYKKIGL